MRLLLSQAAISARTRSLWWYFGAFLFVVIVVSSLVSTALAVTGAVDSNSILNYQLRLTNNNAVPVGGVKNLKITIYDAASGGNQLYTFCATTDSPTGTPESFPVTFTNGDATVLIGDTSITCNSSGFEQAIPASLFTNAALYLGVTVESDLKMTPRKRIVAAGYSLNADLLDDLDTDNDGAATAVVPVTNTKGLFTITGQPTIH